MCLGILQGQGGSSTAVRNSSSRLVPHSRETILSMLLSPKFAGIPITLLVAATRL